MHEIGRSAGVGQGTLYRHYAHKGELCRALLSERIAEFAEEVRARLEQSGGSELESLSWFIWRIVEFNEENAPLLGAIRDAYGGERRIQMRRNPFYEGLRGTVVALLERAVSHGEARSDLDIEGTADAMLAPLDIDLYLYQRHELGMSRQRIVNCTRSLLIGGISSE